MNDFDRGHDERARPSVLYSWYQPWEDAGGVVRSLAATSADMLEALPAPMGELLPVRAARAGCEVIAGTGLSHDRPPWRIGPVMLDGEEIDVEECPAVVTPFATLLHFKKAGPVEQPPVLVVAPLSGHFATLLRSTVATLSVDHDVYVTDWHNARDVPLSDGVFGKDEYVDHLIRFSEHIGPAHMVAVCQPCVPALIATAVMAEAKSPGRPLSLTLMAGPVDARVNPTVVDDLATQHPIEWFEDHVVTTVPARFPGAGRRVYPGFLQLGAFVGMNTARHVRSHLELYGRLVRGEWEQAAATRRFYDEYFAVLDMPAEFYLETVESVFQTFDLARGVAEHHGRRVDPTAIRTTGLMTVEGELDDICAIGQTMAAQDLCTRIPAMRRSHHLQPGVGHYGVFSGRRWEREIAPRLRHFFVANTPR